MIKAHSLLEIRARINDADKVGLDLKAYLAELGEIGLYVINLPEKNCEENV